ncbi:hypothetical protein [Bacterioplanoides pacificum]|uniref:Uncharacterized protein n=1 Tax=Bacterioplanoides pacificum TaxID=1171596 RepID=A0ABV7VRX8_9GAMM
MQAIQRFLIATMLMLGAYAQAAPAYQGAPADDARLHYQQGQIAFVGIQLAEELEIPGLKPAQQDVVRQQYEIRPLNRRWKTFANIEQQADELGRLRSYAVRYNLMMWKLDRSPKSDRFKYRY